MTEPSLIVSSRILLPLLRAFNALPPSLPSPLVPPMTHIIHSLITIPVTPSLRPKWFQSSRSGSPKGRDSPVHSPPHSTSPSASGSPTLGPSKDAKHSAFDRAISKLNAGRRSISLSRSTSPVPFSHVDVLQRAYDLLDVAFLHYLPGNMDPDDMSVRERCRAEGNPNLDDVLSPLVLLVNKLCAADEGSRTRMRNRILPPDLDRTSPLEGRPDFLGRCLRLLSCVHHQRLKQATGEMLYSICDCDGEYRLIIVQAMFTDSLFQPAYWRHMLATVTLPGSYSTKASPASRRAHRMLQYRRQHRPACRSIRSLVLLRKRGRRLI